MSSSDGQDGDIKQKELSGKDLAKKMRREAYQRAKDFKKNDPRELQRKALAKEQRQAAYRKAKERQKTSRKIEKSKPDVRNLVTRASDLTQDDRPLAQVIAIDFIKRTK